MTVERGERDAEMLGIGLAKLGNLMGDFAGIVGCKIPVACVQKPQQRRRGGRPIARKRGRRRWHHIHGNVRGVSQGSRHVTPQGGASKPPCRPVGAAACRVRGQSASGFDDRHHLAFGDEIVNRDQNGFQRSRGRRSDGYLHLHRFDKDDVRAVANFSARLEREGADAPGDFCDDLDIWHANRLFVVAAQCLR